MGISRIFDMSRRSLATYQKALDVTAHNIANASNENYSRQISVFNTEDPEKNGSFIWGTGVKIEQVMRVKDDLLNKQINNYNQKLANADKQLQYLSEIEQIFTEPSDLGISNLMNQFFNSWSELSVSPDSMTLRNGVINSAQNLSAKFGEVFEQFDLLKDDLTYQFDAKVAEANTLINTIKELNDAIYEGKVFGANPNDLMDDRDAKINELSELVNIHVTQDKKGGSIIAIGGITVVNDAYSVELVGKTINGQMTLVTSDTGKSTAVTGGELFAIKDIFGTKLPQYEAELNSIMSKMVESVNNIHSTGYTVNSPAETGINFFDTFTNGALTINQDVLDDPRKIAVSADGTNGNAELAAQIAELGDQKLIDGVKLSDKYNTMINNIGNLSLNNQRLSEANGKILEQLKNQQSSESGVSLDEEMANILKFQRSYDAAARLIKIADEMLDSLMSIV